MALKVIIWMVKNNDKLEIFPDVYKKLKEFTK